MIRRVVQKAFEGGTRVLRTAGSRRAAGAVVLAGALSLVAPTARAETFVLVYSEGSVVMLPGGITVSKGEQIESRKLVQLGPADQAIFVSESGNLVRRHGPYCGTVAGPVENRSSGGLLAPLFKLFGNETAEPAPQGCLK